MKLYVWFFCDQIYEVQKEILINERCVILFEYIL